MSVKRKINNTNRYTVIDQTLLTMLIILSIKYQTRDRIWTFSEWVGEFQKMIQYASYSVDQLIFGNSASDCDQISLLQLSNVINDMLYLLTFSQWYALYIDLFPMICSIYWPMPNIDCTCMFLHNVISCLRQYITSVTISKCETTFDWIIYLEMVAYSLCIMQCI